MMNASDSERLLMSLMMVNNDNGRNYLRSLKRVMVEKMKAVMVPTDRPRRHVATVKRLQIRLAFS